MIDKMDSDEGKENEDLLLKTGQPFEIIFYQEVGAAALKQGKYDRAKEMYNNGLEEIDEYRQNIEIIRETASLNEEDRRHLEKMEQELDGLEHGFEQQLELIE